MRDHASDSQFDRDRLTAMDEAALEVLVEAGFDLSKVATNFQARAGVVARLLGLLDGPAPQADPSLVDVTVARILRASPNRRAVPTGDAEDVLVPEDDDALDAYVSAGFRVDRVPAVLRARAARLDALGTLLTSGGEPASASIVARTMAAIPIRSHPVERPFRSMVGSFRLTDLVSVAAVLLIGASVLWPILSTVSANQKRLACAENMSSVAAAMGIYSGDYKGSLPMAAAGFGGTWWDVGGGPGRSNSANLFQLPKLKYAAMSDLACPGNADAPCGPCNPTAGDWGCITEVSYSYQVMTGPRPDWKGATPTVILADGSPVTRNVREGRHWSVTQNSSNHDGKGQWALRNDGSAGWLSTPVIGGDNIWLPGSHDRALARAQQAVDAARRAGIRKGVVVVPILQGVESPESENDSFLGP